MEELIAFIETSAIVDRRLYLEKEFQSEIKAVRAGSVAVATYFADLIRSGKKFKNSCHSAIGYVVGICDEPPDLVKLPFYYLSDLPDIDLDFSDQRRHLVFEYAEKKYGRERVARLGSVGMFKPKSVLNQVGMALKIPQWDIDELSNTVIKRSTGDSRAGSSIEDTFKDTEIGRKLFRERPEIMISSRMEGHPNNEGQHAAGVVITEDPVADIVAVDARTGATMCDKKDAEDLGLLKIDALGLTQLGIFERVLDLIGERGLSRFLENIPLDDQAAFDVLNAGHFAGIFQFDSKSASSLMVREMINEHGGKIDQFEDLVSLTALVRPGPLGSGAAGRWMRRRTGKEKVDYPHQALEPFIESTLGIVIYQEQVMQIGREIGGLSWDDVTALRKAMSRSLGKEYFDKYGDPWKVGAAAHGIPEDLRNKIWDDLCLFGMWAFNRSHSVAYATVSYWCLWLKAHFPVEYAAATLDAEGDSLMQVVTLRELRTEGVDYVPIDPDRSTDKWSPAVRDGKKILVGPLTAIKGIGPAKVRQIMDSRISGKPLTPSLRKQLENCVTDIDSLSPISETISRLVPDLSAAGIVSLPIQIGEAVCGRWSGPIVVMGMIKKISPLNENEPARVARRNGRAYTGPLEALNLFLKDDSGDEIFCKIDRFRFAEIGRPTLEKCRAGKSLYAIKGTIPPDFRMIKVSQIKYLGEIDD